MAGENTTGTGDPGDGSPTGSTGAPLADSTNDGENTTGTGASAQPLGDEGAARSDQQQPAADPVSETLDDSRTGASAASPAAQPPAEPPAPPAEPVAPAKDTTKAAPSGDPQPPKAGDIDPLTGDKLVKVNLKNSVGMNGMPLYGPGKGILVPERIARAAGWNDEKAEEMNEAERQQRERDQYVDARP